jgi:DNA mismatch endonuclease, patch repair protein
MIGAMADNLTPDQRRRTMSRIARKNTKPELMLRRGLWAKGIRGYRIDAAVLPGRPDLAFGKAKVAVFVDGKFWHGHPSAYTPGRHGSYWDEKIERNMRRDRSVERELADMGWQVLRFWDFQVLRSLTDCVDEIGVALASRRRPPRVSPARAPVALELNSDGPG